MPAIITKGAFSAQGYGFGARAAGAATYIEDVFSTYIYTGNGTSQTITNNIDLSTKGGLVWLKSRSAGISNTVYDTVRGATNSLVTNDTSAQSTISGVTAFNNDGFSVGSYAGGNGSLSNIASWTFRKQPKFFDVVTYTGDGVAGRTVAHNLGSVPGMIIIKRLNSISNWAVAARQNDTYMAYGASTYAFGFNTTEPAILNAQLISSVCNSATFTPANVADNQTCNFSGATYVAYIYAHNAGGFGAAGTDNVISCGSFTDDGVGNVNVTLGWEPQYILVKRTSAAQDWFVFDTMRGASYAFANYLKPNLNNAEATFSGTSMVPTATGFTSTGTFSGTYIYMAIRRGPMKTPTDATKVFSPVAYTGDNSSTRILTSGFPIDLVISEGRSEPFGSTFDRLRGVYNASPELFTPYPYAESNNVYGRLPMTGLQTGNGTTRYNNDTGVNYVDYFFARAPGFFDEVCYTGTGSARTVTHNLGVVPELMIVKKRNGSDFWECYSAALGSNKGIELNSSGAAYTSSLVWNNTNPTASVFTLGTMGAVNDNTYTFVAYLFATCPGVSKVGSYTGTGAAQNINCGFAASARFILIKRTDSTGDWYVYDSARGISASNDPYLLLNSTAAEVTTTNYVGTYASGFALTSTAPAALNANGGSFIFLAVA